ncbi:hypothetical protein JCM13369A_28210 [Mediterraneibacter glycyrrhizinilyticus JCM 13369]
MLWGESLSNQCNLEKDDSLASLYNVNLMELEDMPISCTHMKSSTYKILSDNGIKTIKCLLNMTPMYLQKTYRMSYENMMDIGEFCESIGGNIQKYKSFGNRYLKEFYWHNIEIAQGDFSFEKSMELSGKSSKDLDELKKAYTNIGEDLALRCVKRDSFIYDTINMLETYIAECKLHDKLRKRLKALPEGRKDKIAEGYINAYTFDDELRDCLKKYCESTNTTLYGLTEKIDTKNKILYGELCLFFDWCKFNLKEEIKTLFERLYKNEREKEVIKRRAMNQTLAEIGNDLGVTRERVRQIENKVKKKFSEIHREVRVVSKISAERNGDLVLTPSEIGDYAEEYTEELLFLLKSYEGINFTYDAQLDVFVVGNDSIKEQAERYVEMLPDVIHEDNLKQILKDANKQEGLPEEIVEKVIQDSYGFTASVYHRYRLSLGSIYQEIIKKYYPDGIKVYDIEEIKNFRKYVEIEYGDVKLAQNDRALSSRISNICILCGRGKYKLKQDNYISKELAKRIYTYMKNSENVIFMTNTLFSLFEEDLLKEGIDNKYYLQGILRELYENEFTFRRDYVSKDAEITSIYSSILEFIKKSEYPVSKNQIKESFPGVTEIVFNLAVSDECILNYFGEYLHSSKLRITESEKKYLYDVIARVLSDNDSHHSKDFYEIIDCEKPEILTRNAALYQFSSFSILEYLFKDKFQFSRPYIAKKGVEIGRAGERLHDLIYSEDEFTLSDISEFGKENYFQISSIIEYVNDCNDEFLLVDDKKIKRISDIGINEQMALAIEGLLLEEVFQTVPIRDLSVWNKLPTINVPWTEWLLYSMLNKWGHRTEVSMSSNQFRLSIPLVAPIGKLVREGFENLSRHENNPSAKVDNLDDIDLLLEDIIDDEILMEEV